MHPNLSFDQAPPISVPFRFFLTAPLFGVLAGVLLIVDGGGLLHSRWLPETLAATHLLVAGFMLQAMTGALMQFVPVAAGGNVWRPQWVAGFVHPLLVVSACLLVAAFLSQRPGLFVAAAHGFSMGLGVFLLVIALALWRSPAQGATITALRMATASLLVTLVLGVALARVLAGGSDASSFLAWVDVHAAWGLWGWGLFLLSGVAYFVVPMFQLTPPYPATMTRSFPWLLVMGLLLWSVQPFVGGDVLKNAGLLCGLLAAGVFAGVTIHLQMRRRRKISDTTLRYFRLAMFSLLTVVLLGAGTVLFPHWSDNPGTIVTLGILVTIGVFVSAISGMLYKIVPFISWLHLQRASGLHSMPPTMNQMLSEPAMRGQFYMHVIALTLLVMAVWVPQLARAAGAAFALDCAWLAHNLARAMLTYRGFRRRIPSGASGHESGPVCPEPR